MVASVPTVGSVGDDHSFSLVLEVLLLGELGEAPLVGDDDLLSTGELVLGSAQSLNDVLGYVVLRSDGQQYLLDVYTSDETLGLTEGTSHTGLKSKE